MAKFKRESFDHYYRKPRGKKNKDSDEDYSWETEATTPKDKTRKSERVQISEIPKSRYR